MILDTFVSVFTADVSDLKKGEKESRKTADEIMQAMKDAQQKTASAFQDAIQSFSDSTAKVSDEAVDAVKKVETQAKKSETALQTFAKRAAAFLTTTFAAKKLVGISTAQADVINNMAQTADSIGVAAGEMDAFNKAMGDSGATAQASEAALISVFSSAGQAADDATSQQAKAFQQLGISISDAEGKTKDSVTLMRELAQASETLDSASAVNLYKQLGITDTRVQQQLLLGRRALDDQIKTHKQLGVVTKEQVEQAQRYSNAQGKLTNALERGARSIMQALLPAITWVIEKFTLLVDWANENKNFIVGFFTAIALAVSAIYLPAMVAAAAATLVAIAPILAIAAAIGLAAVAIAAIYDDIMNWIDGNDSLIGQMIERFPIIGTIIENVIEVVKSIINWFGEFKNFVVDVFGKVVESAKAFGRGAIQVFDSVVGAVASMADAMAKILNSIFNMWTSIFQAIKDFVQPIIGSISSGLGVVSSGIKKVGSWIGWGDDDEAAEPIQDLSAAHAYVNTAQASPLNSTNSNVINNMRENKHHENNVTIGELKIETQATDAQGIAGDARSELQAQLKNLQDESGSGVEM